MIIFTEMLEAESSHYSLIGYFVATSFLHAQRIHIYMGLACHPVAIQ